MSIPSSTSGRFSSSSLQEPLSVVLSSNQGQHSEIEKKEQQSRIVGLPLELLENIFTFLNPKEYTVVSGVNREFRYLSKSLKQQGKFPVVIGGIILSYLEDHEVPSVEREFTLNDSIQLMKKTYKSEINTKSKKFSDLIRQQFEQELKNKEIPENYKEQLESIEKIVPSDVTLKVLKVLDLKKKIQIFNLLNSFSKEFFNSLKKRSDQQEDSTLLFQDVFTWSKAHRTPTPFYPMAEINKFIELSVLSNKEDEAIEVLSKMKGRHFQRFCLSIVLELIKVGNYTKAIKLAYAIQNKYDQKDAFFKIANAVKLGVNDKEKSELCAMAKEWITKISDLTVRNEILKIFFRELEEPEIRKEE